MKKQIKPSVRAHLLRSALILLSLFAICAIPFAPAQSRSRETNNRSVANRPDGSEFPIKNINSPKQSAVSPASFQPSIATHQTWVELQEGLQELIGFRNASEITPPIETVSEVPATGLIINPHYDSSVPLAMHDMIEQNIIPIYESLFSDPITIDILFRYSDTAPNGDPFPPGVLAASFSTIYTVSWNDFISALRADARTSNDNIAIASLPGRPLSTNIAPSSANGRAVGFNNTPPAMFSDGTIGPGGPYDGIVTLNSAEPFWFSRPLISGSFDAQRAVEHEMDEIMGLGSYLNRNASPCLSFEAESPSCPQPPGEVCTIIAGGAVIQSCPNCSGGLDVGFVGNNSGTLQFNQIFANASGRLDLRIWYANGDATRYAFLSVNGAPGTSLTFPSTGSFQTVGSIEITITNLIPGGNNTLKFYNPVVGYWGPDFDRIEVACTIPPPASIRPQDLFSWSSPGVRNLTSDGSRYFSIDSGTTNIVNFNQTPPGDFGDWLSEPCPQRHPYVQNAFVCPNQFSDISATSPEGINLDVVGYDLVNATTAYLANLSTRTFVQTGDNVMIGGFIVQGSQPKRVILRAIGPELSQHGVPNAMANPTLELHNADGALIASNDNWQNTIIAGIITGDQVQDIQNSGHAPGDPNESAIIADLPPGNYTAIVRGVGSTTGIALVEVYDLSPSLQSILGNISTRSLVETGDNVMIGGFIVQGAQPKNVIVRAIGPELSQHGVLDFLANPTLELHNGNGDLIAANDNWQSTIIGGIITSSQVQNIQNSGHAPTDPSESAIIANLPPGNYTAIVRGVNNTTGIALVEVYDLH